MISSENKVAIRLMLDDYGMSPREIVNDFESKGLSLDFDEVMNFVDQLNVNPCRTMKSNTFITYNGERMTISEWAETTGIARHTIYHRLKKGWSVKQALTTPVKRCKNNVSTNVR